MNIQRIHNSSLAIIGITLLAACSTNSTDLRDEEQDVSKVRCANGQPLACVEKMGKKVSCTCDSRRGLERLTKGGLRNW